MAAGAGIITKFQLNAISFCLVYRVRFTNSHTPSYVHSQVAGS